MSSEKFALALFLRLFFSRGKMIVIQAGFRPTPTTLSRLFWINGSNSSIHVFAGVLRQVLTARRVETGRTRRCRRPSCEPGTAIRCFFACPCRICTERRTPAARILSRTSAWRCTESAPISMAVCIKNHTGLQSSANSATTGA